MPRIRRLLAFLLLTTTPLAAQSAAVVTTDIDNFWRAYDAIRATPDTAVQRRILEEEFLRRGTEGLRLLREARGYTTDEYLDAIRSYPRFWAAVRRNTLRASVLAADLEAGVAALRRVYPTLRPATIYLTVGALRTGGTTREGQVLIGSELALADSTTPTDEFPERLAHLAAYFRGNPIAHVVPLNVHEYVHTQQRDHPYQLLHRTVFEGIAEFVSTLATRTNPTFTPMTVGRARDPEVREAFSRALLSPHAVGHWMYNDTLNRFGVRDLGYYVGYMMAARYLQQRADTLPAIREMIDLTYDSLALQWYVDRGGYLGRPLRQLITDYERERPIVTRVIGVRPGGTAEDPAIRSVTVEFSRPMNTRQRGFDVGPAGSATVLRVQRFTGFSPDGRQATFEVSLQAATEYQLELTDNWRDVDGVPLRPYLLTFRTRG